MRSELGGAKEVVELFHHIWYGEPCEPVVTFAWVMVLAAYRQRKKDVKITDKGFSVDPSMIRSDGKIMRDETKHDPADVEVYWLVNKMFGYT